MTEDPYQGVIQDREVWEVRIRLAVLLACTLTSVVVVKVLHVFQLFMELKEQDIVLTNVTFWISTILWIVVMGWCVEGFSRPLVRFYCGVAERLYTLERHGRC
jgi:hypothetical protein